MIHQRIFAASYVWVQSGYEPRDVLSTLHKPSSQFRLRTDAMFKRRRGNGNSSYTEPLARITDTLLGLKDTSDILREFPSRYANERVQCLKKTLYGQKSDPGLDSEGVHSKDRLTIDEPIALRTRRKFKLQYPPEGDCGSRNYQLWKQIGNK